MPIVCRQRLAFAAEARLLKNLSSVEKIILIELQTALVPRERKIFFAVCGHSAVVNSAHLNRILWKRRELLLTASNGHRAPHAGVGAIARRTRYSQAVFILEAGVENGNRQTCQRFSYERGANAPMFAPWSGD
ncbi:hypothetical protein [Trinickia soli]|uniref:hypothetical protein n=1 Tax=Trinickia soli TaxID=380675 RepID=UPI0011AED08D|nr:hypothetical protein [Trinickia soli]